jgi:hypothetical protein
LVEKVTKVEEKGAYIKSTDPTNYSKITIFGEPTNFIIDGRFPQIYLFLRKQY